MRTKARSQRQQARRYAYSRIGAQRKRQATVQGVGAQGEYHKAAVEASSAAAPDSGNAGRSAPQSANSAALAQRTR